MNTSIKFFLLLFFLIGFTDCTKQKVNNIEEKVTGNWEVIAWSKYKAVSDNLFLKKEEHPNNEQNFPGIHLAKVYGTSNGIKIENNQFSHLQLIAGTITRTLPATPLTISASLLTFYDRDGEIEVTLKAEIVELKDDFLWIKYNSPEGFTFEYQYRKL